MQVALISVFSLRSSKRHLCSHASLRNICTYAYNIQNVALYGKADTEAGNELELGRGESQHTVTGCSKHEHVEPENPL
jgi:hypothetical protein